METILQTKNPDETVRHIPRQNTQKNGCIFEGDEMKIQTFEDSNIPEIQPALQEQKRLSEVNGVSNLQSDPPKVQYEPESIDRYDTPNVLYYLIIELI